MTPAEARALSVPEYIALMRFQDEEIRERNRQARKQGKRG
jgi:hypothetical protein